MVREACVGQSSCVLHATSAFLGHGLDPCSGVHKRSGGAAERSGGAEGRSDGAEGRSGGAEGRSGVHKRLAVRTTGCVAAPPPPASRRRPVTISGAKRNGGGGDGTNGVLG